LHKDSINLKIKVICGIKFGIKLLPERRLLLEKEIMLAVDASIYSKNAVNYAVKMASIIKELSYTLFYVQPAISKYLIEKALSTMNMEAKAELRTTLKKDSKDGELILENYKNDMINAGIDGDKIKTITRPNILSVSEDIALHAREGLYDAIVVGRRAYARGQEFLMDSVTAKLLKKCRLIPIWIVDGEVSSSKIMLAIDGSEVAFQAVDHLSFMLSGNSEIKISLFHVVPALGSHCEIRFGKHEGESDKFITEGKCLDNFYAHLQKKFKEGGINDDQVEIKIIEGKINVGKAILKEAEKGDYGTLVIGRSTMNKSFIRSVSKYVLDKTSNRALWLVS
jgi:nucleotide-binding universal stress UspA family protein